MKGGSIIKKYKIYIRIGGTQEDPNIYNEDILIVYGRNADEAIEKWIERTGCNEKEYLHRGKKGVGWTYYYPIICEEM